MEQYGNTSTYNIETVLYQNVQNSEYFKNNCVKLSAIDELIDEVYYSVDNVEPWMSGNARGASSAFCLLFRLGQLKPTDEEVQKFLDHSDSPFIRALGFLYLRYVVNPRQIWDWLQYYIEDREEFQPSGPTGKTVTIGVFARDIFLDQYYFETIFPRIPKPVSDDLAGKLTAAGLPGKAIGNAGQGGADRRGVEDGSRRPASVKASLSVAFGQRAPNRSAGREEGRGLGSSMKGGAGTASAARRDDSRGTVTNGGSTRGGSGVACERPRDYRDRDRDRNRGPDHRDTVPDRDGDRDRDSGRDRDRVRDRDRYASSSHRDRDRDSRYDRDRDRRDYRGSSRDADRGGLRGGSRQRSSSRDRGSRDVFRDRAGGSRGGSRDRY